jgi:hypothetical protein
MQGVHPRTWRQFGFGGPPEPWDHGAKRDLDRLATSYYLDVLESHRRLEAELDGGRSTVSAAEVEELFAAATRHKHEIEYTLRHWATPVEQVRVEDRLGSLMRISRRFRALLDLSSGPPVRAA